MRILIRTAGVTTDWLAGIWPIFHDAVVRGDTYAFDPGISERDARFQWFLPDPANVFVAVDAETGAVCGTSLIKPNQPRLGAHVANAAFMVSPALLRRGIGRALGNHALAWARETGYAAMQFNFRCEHECAGVGPMAATRLLDCGHAPRSFSAPDVGTKS